MEWLHFLVQKRSDFLIAGMYLTFLMTMIFMVKSYILDRRINPFSSVTYIVSFFLTVTFLLLLSYDRPYHAWKISDWIPLGIIILTWISVAAAWYETAEEDYLSQEPTGGRGMGRLLGTMMVVFVMIFMGYFWFSDAAPIKIKTFNKLKLPKIKMSRTKKNRTRTKKSIGPKKAIAASGYKDYVLLSIKHDQSMCPSPELPLRITATNESKKVVKYFQFNIDVIPVGKSKSIAKSKPAFEWAVPLFSLQEKTMCYRWPKLTKEKIDKVKLRVALKDQSIKYYKKGEHYPTK